MNTLQTIQKTFRVFQILTKVAFIFSIVGATICAVGALCSITWYTGGQVFTLFGEPITFFTDSEGANQAMAVLFSDLVMLTTDAILLGFAGRYFKIEQAEGTPFTANGAELLKKLGIRCIYMPIVAVVIAAVITVSLGAEESGDLSNLPGVVTGIVLILTSIIFRYGAELEQKVKTDSEER
ncbi:MAG: hypothetical protein PUE84_09135 [Firmicutes bacterium]|nr:hypothetical protein [Bacillota bacterium]